MLESGAGRGDCCSRPMCGAAVKGAEELLGEGIEVSIVNARFVRPLDENADSGACGKLSKAGGRGGERDGRRTGSAILELLSDKGLTDVVVKRLGLPDRFIEHGSQTVLRESVGLTSERIAEAVREIWRRK